MIFISTMASCRNVKDKTEELDAELVSSHAAEETEDTYLEKHLIQVAKGLAGQI